MGTAESQGDRGSAVLAWRQSPQDYNFPQTRVQLNVERPKLAGNKDEEMDDPEIQKLVSQYETQMPNYDSYASAMQSLITQCIPKDIHMESSHRAKKVKALRDKIRTQQAKSLSEVPDLAGIRLIVEYRWQVHEICRILSEEFLLIDDDPHDAASPDAFGYKSRHMILELSSKRADLTEYRRYAGLHFEVQVRTILQHAWASISHSTVYRSEQDAPAGLLRKLAQVAALLEISDDLFESFHHDSQRVMGDYVTSLEEGSWRELPINIDSLQSTWSEWYPRDLEASLEERGILVHQVDTDDDDFLEYLSDLVLLSNALGLSRLGNLVEALSDKGTVNGLSHDFREKNSISSYTMDYISVVALYWTALKTGTNLGREFRSGRYSANLVGPSGPPHGSTNGSESS